jgi:hypothetical protein
VPAANAPRKKPKPRPGNGPPSTSDSDSVCPYSWAYTVYGLNCEVVWPSESEVNGNDDEASSLVAGPELDNDEYTGNIEKDWVVEMLLAQGGVRLAGSLNSIFARQQ